MHCVRIDNRPTMHLRAIQPTYPHPTLNLCSIDWFGSFRSIRDHDAAHTHFIWTVNLVEAFLPERAGKRLKGDTEGQSKRSLGVYEQKANSFLKPKWLPRPSISRGCVALYLLRYTGRPMLVTGISSHVCFQLLRVETISFTSQRNFRFCGCCIFFRRVYIFFVWCVGEHLMEC